MFTHHVLIVNIIGVYTHPCSTSVIVNIIHTPVLLQPCSTSVSVNITDVHIPVPLQ